MTTRIAPLALAATIAVAAFAPATGSAKATDTGKHTVAVESTYVYKQAGKIFDGTLTAGESFTVKRLSKSGRYAYGMAYGHVNRHAWIRAADLQRKGMGQHTVTAESTYVYKQAGKIFDGTLFAGESFTVKRLSKSGKYAYGMAYGHVNRHAWVLTSDLAAKR